MNLQIMLQAKLAVLKFIQSSFLIDTAEKLKLNESTLQRLLLFIERDDFENALNDPILIEISARENLDLVKEWNQYLNSKRKSMKEKLNNFSNIGVNKNDLEKFVTNTLNNL